MVITTTFIAANIAASLMMATVVVTKPQVTCAMVAVAGNRTEAIFPRSDVAGFLHLEQGPDRHDERGFCSACVHQFPHELWQFIRAGFVQPATTLRFQL